MIAKGGSISHTSNAIGYAQEKQKTVGLEGKEITQSASMEIDRSLVSGETKEEVFQEFKMFQAQNTRCEKNTLAFVVSPTEADGKNLTAKDYQAIGRDFLKNLSNEINQGLQKEGKPADIDLLKNNQYISYLHDDKKCKHLHIFVNRITLDGKAVPDSYISNRASRSAEKVAQDRGMTLAKDIQLQRQHERKHVLEAHKSVLKDKPISLEDYALKMEEKGYKPSFRFSNANKPVGVQFKVGNELVKGSAINKVMSAARIEKAVLEIGKQITRNLGRGFTQSL